jgi:hypothetical protein
MPPYAYVSDGQVVKKPTVEVPNERFGRAGLAAEGLEPEDFLPRFTSEAVNPIFRTRKLSAIRKSALPARSIFGTNGAIMSVYERAFRSSSV